MSTLKLTLLGNYDTPDYAYGVAVQGNVAYVADGLSGLQLIDISDATQPIKLGSYDTFGLAVNVAVVGSIAYVAIGRSGLQILDVSNLQQPVLLGSYETNGYAAGITVVNNVAYIADETDGLQLIDVSNASHPHLLGSYDTTGSAESVVVSNNIAYVADLDSGLQVIDVSDSGQPTLMGSYNTAGAALGIDVVGNTAYVADGESGLQVINISNSYRPTLRSSYDTLGAAQAVSVVNNQAFVADYDKGLVVVDVSNPDQPVKLADYNTAGFAFSTAVVGDMAYLADEEYGLQVFQTSSSTPTYAISLDSTPVSESDTAYFRLTTTNVPNNTEVVFTLSGTISAADAQGGLPIPSFYVWNNTATVAVGFVNDNKTEGEETLTATLANGHSATVTVNDTSTTPPVTGTNHPGVLSISDTTPMAGQTLTTSLKDDDGLSSAINYQWQVGTALMVNNSPTYTVATADVGKTIAVTARYTDDGGTKETVTSNATAAVIQASVGVSIETPNDLITHEDDSSTQSTTPIIVSLNTQPVRDVTVKLISTDSSEGVVANANLTFSPDNWNMPQTASIQGVNDYLDDKDKTYSITGTVVTNDVNYTRVAIDPMAFVNVGDKNEVGFDRDVPLQDYDSLGYNTTGFPSFGDSGNGDAAGPAVRDILVGMDGADKLYGYGKQDDLSGGIGNDSLYGGNDNDFLYGQDGNDQLFGEQDDDRLEGGQGNDSLDGGLGKDTLVGGLGSDTYYLGYDAVDLVVDKSENDDIDTVIMPYQLLSYTLPKGIENASIDTGDKGNLTGNASNNRLTGNDGNNKLLGGEGNDSLIGSAGKDVLLGGPKQDDLIGGAGNDVLNGSFGNDLLNGGTGADKLTGGDGKDIFSFASTLKGNIDKITDFKVVDDTLQLDNTIFVRLTHEGALPATAFHIGNAAADNTDKIIYNKATGALYYDDDGNGAHVAVQIATLGVNLALTPTDFMVI